MSVLVPVIWILAVGARAVSGSSVDCTETAESFLQRTTCDTGQNCTVHCKESCLAHGAPVYGTQFYALTSSICKSALHDLRISSWNSSARTVTLQIATTKRQDFAGSLRYGVYSESYFDEVLYFNFTSPRITEKVLDVTSLHRNFIYNSSTTHTLECHGPSNRAIRYEYSIKELMFKKVNLSPPPQKGYYSITFPKVEYPHVRTNMFWCLVENSMLSNIGSPAMFFEDKALPFLPRNYTLTVSPGDTLDLEVTPYRQGEVVSWCRVSLNGSVSEQLTNGNRRMVIQHARLQNNGVYVVNGPFPSTPGRNRAIFRTIVRSCPHGIFGISCNYHCPKCENGGICHDVTGDCICPPGFRGQLCRDACGDDFFGRYCSKRCSVSNPDSSIKSCRGILMCLPDPYGCSCGTGFMGPFCNQTCPAHHFGADCKQSRVCFCKTEATCDVHTGSCSKDQGVCLDGWKHSPFCDISYPLLVAKPIVGTINDTSAVVWFSRWNANRDLGQGNPIRYLIQYRKLNETWSTETVNASSNLELYQKKLTRLQSGSFYEVRVLVVDSDGHHRERGANITKFRTFCGNPMSPPQDVRIDNSSTSEIVITWKNPLRSSWLCWSVNVTLDLNGTTVSMNLTESGATPSNLYRVPTEPYTLLTVRLRLDTPDGSFSAWTTTRTVTSAEDAPNSVTDVRATRITPRQAELTWKAPSKPNGVIRNYKVVYRSLRLLAPSCHPIDQKKTEVVVPVAMRRVNLTSLRPYTLYEIAITAVTIKPGPILKMTFQTEPAVPEGAPLGLTYTEQRDQVSLLSWTAVPCELANGLVQSYYLELDSPDAWETELRNMTTKDLNFRFKDLVPYTRYRARLFAETPAGRSAVAARLNFTTRPAAPLAPADLVAYQLSQTNVSLSWKPPYPPYGVLDHYQIKFWTEEKRFNPEHLDIRDFECPNGGGRGSRHCFTVQDLVPDRIYHFSVRAINNGTTHGPFSVQLEVETREMVPDPPSNVRATDRAEDSLRVQWDEPIRKNGILRAYRVNVSLVHTYGDDIGSQSGDPRTQLLQGVNTREYYLRDLFPGTTYNVCVQASTSAGFGNPDCSQVATRAAVPVVQMEPQVKSIFNNTVTVALKPVNFRKGPITAYYVLVVRGTNDPEEPVLPLNYSEAQEMNLDYYTAARINPNQILRGLFDFVIGNGDVIGGYENPPLSDTTPYRFGLLVQSNFSGEARYGYRLTPPVVVGGGTGAAGIGVVIAALFILLVIVFVASALTYYYFKKRKNVVYRSNSPSKRSLKDRLSRLSKLDENNLSESRMTLNMDGGDCINMVGVPNGGLPTKPVPVKQLQEHVAYGQAHDLLKDEYMTSPRGQLHPWDVAKRQENKTKNRYGNILPYDHSRVILSKLPEGDHTDYINANYVPGYKNARKYIATQGPKTATLPDFWRMVWQEGCCKIVMLTNLKEQEKTKCEKYWPDASQRYGKFTVTLMKTDMQVDFVVREFQLTLEDKSRTVVQFHLTMWPDHGVPLYPDALLPFLRRIADFEPNDDHPVVVHCSGGIGRTGTLILVDTMLSQAQAEGEVNLVSHLHIMRQNRINLVESLEQYVYAYTALVEILCSKSHKLTIKDFVSSYHKLKAKAPGSRKTVLQLEFEELAKMCLSCGDQNDYKSALDPRNASKNRSREILAADSRRPFLSVTPDGQQTDYVNAVYVDGFKRRKAYIVTQLPLPTTVDDFWQMVATSGAKTLVTIGPLQDETCPRFWPDVKGTAQYRKVNVEHVDSEDHHTLVVRTFSVSQQGSAPRTVKQFHVQSWTTSRSVPPSCDLVLELLQHVDRWQMRSEGKSMVVQCLDGCRGCGLFCASAAVCDQLKLEQELDVFRCVQNIRSSRPQFIVDAEQYSFCYDLCLAFLDSFDTYSNFQ